MKEKFMRFMQGRYGVDPFSRFLLGVGLAAIFLSALWSGKVSGVLFYMVGWGLIIYCYFRMFSRNIQKRYAENQKYMEKTYKIREYFRKQQSLWKQRKIYRIYKCPGCGQKIRVPKGKGRIEVRCPKCGATFIKKS